MQVLARQEVRPRPLKVGEGRKMALKWPLQGPWGRHKEKNSGDQATEAGGQA